MMHHINGWYSRHNLYKSSPRCIIISSYSIVYCLWFISLLFISTRAQTLNILAFEYTRNLQEIPNMELDIGQCAHYVEEISPGVPVVRQWQAIYSHLRQPNVFAPVHFPRGADQKPLTWKDGHTLVEGFASLNYMGKYGSMSIYCHYS